jgi:hypothetical protein
LEFDGGSLNPAAGTTLTINGPFHASSDFIFGGAGSVVISRPDKVYVQWFGAKGDGTTDDTVAVQRAVNAAGSAGAYFPCGGTYILSSTITLPSSAGVHGCSYTRDTASPSGTVIKWMGASNGPIFVETGLDINPQNASERGASFGGFTVINGGTASALVGFQANNVTGAAFDHLAMSWPGGTCLQLQSTNRNYPSSGGAALWMERVYIGPDVHLGCGTDIALLTVGGTGSFGYAKFDNPHLDGHALDIGAGSSLFHSFVAFQSNIGSPCISVEGNAQNNFYDIRAESGDGTGQLLNVAANSWFEGQGTLICANCLANTVGSNGYIWVTANAIGDNKNLQNSVTYVPGSDLTTVVATDKSDMPWVGAASFGLYSKWLQVRSGAYLINNVPLGSGCFQLLNGPIRSPSTSYTAYKICDDGGITSGGPISLVAGGTNQNVTLTPSGTGYTLLNGNVGIGTAAVSTGQRLEVNGGIALNTTSAQPTCSSTTRGTFWVTQGASGVKDSVQVCAKDATDTYAWRTIY